MLSVDRKLLNYMVVTTNVDLDINIFKMKVYIYKQTIPSTNIPLHFCRRVQCRIRHGFVDQSYNRHFKRKPIKSPVLVCTVRVKEYE